MYVFIQGAQLAIDARADKAVTRELGQLLFEFSLSAANNRRQDHNALAFGKIEHIVQDLIDTLTGNRRPAFGAVR